MPADILDFAAGPWADVVALAQVSAEGQQDDPSGYLALVPLLLWSAQPELTRLEPERLTHAIPDMLAKLRQVCAPLITRPTRPALSLPGWWHCTRRPLKLPSAWHLDSIATGRCSSRAWRQHGLGTSAEEDSSQALLEPTASQAAALAEDPLPILWWVRGWN